MEFRLYFLIITKMKDDEIIKYFFAYGCKDPEGNNLPLRNCEKINHLYNQSLKEAECCDGLQEKIYETYKHRLKIFLEIERSKEKTDAL